MAPVIVTQPVPVVAGSGASAGGPPSSGPGAAAPQRRPGIGGLPSVNDRDYLPDEVVIQLAANGADQTARSLAQRFRLTQVDSFDIPGAGTRLYRWRIADRRTAPAVVRAIEADRSTISVSLNYIMRLYGEAAAESAPPLEQYLGDEIVARIRRVMRAPVKLLGGYSQTLPSNWKLYMENVKDSYHASLLHTFFTTFRLNRLSQKGGIVVSDCGGHHVSYSLAADTGGREYEQAGMRAAQEGFGLEAPELLEAVDEFGDGVGLQILSVFPIFVLQQTRNSLAVRRLVRQGLDRTELVWTCFGFEGDDEAMTERRLRQANLIGPAGYISMEDGAAPGFVQRATATADDPIGYSAYATASPVRLQLCRVRRASSPVSSHPASSVASRPVAVAALPGKARLRLPSSGG